MGTRWVVAEDRAQAVRMRSVRACAGPVRGRVSRGGEVRLQKEMAMYLQRHFISTRPLDLNSPPWKALHRSRCAQLRRGWNGAARYRLRRRCWVNRFGVAESVSQQGFFQRLRQPRSRVSFNGCDSSKQTRSSFLSLVLWVTSSFLFFVSFLGIRHFIAERQMRLTPQFSFGH